MARTNDPHEAALKAWRTRKRAQQQAAGNAPVQVKGDFAKPPPKPKGFPLKGDWRFPNDPGAGPHIREGVVGGVIHPLLRPWGTPSALNIPKESNVERLMVIRAPHVRLTMDEAQNQEYVARKTKQGMRDIEIPDGALDGLTSIDMNPAREFEWHGPAGGTYRRRGDRPPHADYQGQRMRVRVNCDHFANRPPARIAKSVSHEIGHHVHMARLTPEAAAEWSRISNGGRNCRLSGYGQSDASEHFAEVFAAYSRAKPMPPEVEVEYQRFHREHLRTVEPEAFAFMERLFRNPSSMMRAGGRAQYERGRVR